jgi:hypothetical protein
MLNKTQKKILLIGIGLIVIMSLFPPWICEHYERDATGRFVPSLLEKSASEYHFILARHLEVLDQRLIYIYRLDYGRLFLQWLLVIVVAGGFMFLFPEPQKSKTND